MPFATDFAQIPYPGNTDADNPPGDFASLAQYLDTRVLLRAANSADRDAKYSGVPDGVIVVSTTDGTIWIRAGGAWLVLWAPVGRVNCSMPSNNTGNPQALMEWVGGKRRVLMSGTISKTDGSNFISENLAGVGVFCTVPASMLPSQDLYGVTCHVSILLSLTGGSFAPAGRGQINTTTGDLTIFGNQDPDTAVFKDTAWVNLNAASYWMDA